ncbi:serine carboxypeptidase-domain-containing protein, partial [Phakopsora pachyrhizi]
HLWFWLIRSNHIPKRQKFVIWFNGGPGCSSLEGAFLEIGPFRVTDPSETDGSVKLVNSPISWSEYTTLLFIDQPAGSGFSYVNDREHVEELSEVADQLVTFLGNFYTHFPEYSNVDTYLAGESYAGQYIPYMARAILDKTTLETPLKGIIIGNAWLNPFVQYPAYLDYLFEKELIVKGSEKGYEAEKAFEGCKRALASEGGDQKVLITECEFALQSILNKASKTVDGLEMTPIPFNVTQFTTEKHPKWPKGTLNVLKYLQQDDVVKAFHADRKKSKWVDCNSTVADEMWTPKSLPSSTLIPNLVSKIKVLFYAGDQDYMCNALGINRSISIMSWNGQTGWGTDSDGNMVQDQDYVINGVKEGSWIQARGMSYVKFDRASHMVPTDLPFATHDMLLRFLEIDPLSSAGPAGQIPSQLGTNGSQIILAKTHRNGSVLMDEIDPKLLKVEPKPLPIGSAPVLETIEEREAYYGPRQTITLLIVMCGSLFGIIVLIKLRRRRRR